MAGRPSQKVEISLTNPLRSLIYFRRFCDDNDEGCSTIRTFAQSLLNLTRTSTSQSSQTESDASFMIQNVCELSETFTSYEKSYLISNLWSTLHTDFQVKLFFLFYGDFDNDQQADTLALLGDSLNEIMYEASKNTANHAKDLDLDKLCATNKKEFYQTCDIRLKNFIDSLTAKKVNDNTDCVNYKYNVYENILKARNSKFVSDVGVKEHMVSYLSSNKSIHNSQVFSKQGGKGTRPVLEMVLKNSESVCKFKPPTKSTLFYSFDNIQTLLKSHRIGGDQRHILAIVVCSILCLQWENESNIQFEQVNSPTNWNTNYKHEPKKDMFIEKLSSETLKTCLKIEKEEEELFDALFDSELKNAMDFVSDDMNESNEDSIDAKSRELHAKRRKLCEKNHINDNVRSNRKICDREDCKAKLKMGRNIATTNNIEKTMIKPKMDKEIKRAKTYLNVPNVLIDDVPKELAVGAVAINPNCKKRIALVLDEIIEAAGMKNKHSVKLKFTEKEVIKIFNEDPELRKFLLVTADGLPYKVIIDLIKNVHTCADCGKRFDFLAEMSEHMKTIQHREYFQTYGSIIPNIGQFHYALTMLRSLVKLLWDIDYQVLVESIHFETPKAQFMQQKVTDFRKSLDTCRTVHEAKLRELVTPFVKFARENTIPIDSKAFYAWKTKYVRCETYESVFQIEKYFGTSFLLYHAALRANNAKLVNIAKKFFSPLFHVNQHPNYAVMDIHVDYLENTLAEKVPDLKKYLDARKCTNLTGKPYSSEPHDERHEEYNKRGLNMQNIKTVDDFKQSFQLVDHFTKMKDSCFEDYGIKIHGGNTITNQEYEENISRMRVAMRNKSYLSRPQTKRAPLSLDSKELNPKLPSIVNIARDQRQVDVLNVIRHNDFAHGYATNSKFKVLKNEIDEKLGINYEMQLNILIASEENAELRENLREYCNNSRNHPDFDDEKLVEDILAKKFSFL